MNRNRSLVLLSFLVLAACGGSVESSQPDPTAEMVDSDVKGGPKYTVASAAVLGKYTSTEGCAGGFDACDEISVSRAKGKTTIHFGGKNTNYPVRVWDEKGVVLFTTDDMTDGDCDSPGCGNMVKITGVIYPVKQGAKWVPQLKATFAVDFPYPESDEDPSGIEKTVLRFKKAP